MGENYELRWQKVREYPEGVEVCLYRHEVEEYEQEGEKYFGLKEFVLSQKGEIRLEEGRQIPPEAIFRIPLAALPTQESVAKAHVWEDPLYRSRFNPIKYLDPEKYGSLS